MDIPAILLCDGTQANLSHYSPSFPKGNPLWKLHSTPSGIFWNIVVGVSYLNPFQANF